MMGLFGPPDVGKLKARRDVKRLIEALGYRKDSAVRTAAATALGDIAALEAVVPLLRCMEEVVHLGDRATEEDREFSTSAAYSLVAMGAPAVDALVNVLKGDDKSLYGAVWFLLQEMIGKSAVKPLINALRGLEGPACGRIIVTLEGIGAPAVAPLVAALGDDDSDVQTAAMIILGRIGEPAVGALIHAVRSRSVDTAAAAVTFGRIGRSAIAPLIELMEEGCKAADEAIELPEEGPVEPLDTSSLEPGVELATTAALGLQGIGKPAVEPLIAAALGDRSPSIRCHAIRALGGIGDPRAVEPLRQMRNDPDEYVREAVAEALQKLGDT